MKNLRTCQVDKIMLILAVFILFLLPGCNKKAVRNAGEDTGQPGTMMNSEQNSDEMLAVQLYFYNYLDDKAIDQVVPCSPDAVKSVERKIPKTDKYIKDTINLLLKGQVTEEEKSYGFMTEFPDPGLTLESVALSEDGQLALDFNDKNGFLSGGSCRVGILYSQIEKTAKQFIEVESVNIAQDEQFQP